MTVTNPTLPQEKPSHPGLIRIVRQGSPELFSSKLVAERDFDKGSVIVKLEGLTPGPKLYSSVQISEHEHIELNSDLLFMNHSCNPSTQMDVDHLAIVALREIKTGDELTFFYPSTEWDMAQPFDCWCGSPKCIQIVRGAHHIPTATLNEFVLSNHIRALIERRDYQ